MKHVTLSLIIFAVLVVFTKKSTAQTTDTSSYKYKLSKTWYYNYSESFGVKTNPDSTQKNDMVVFNPNMTYEMTIDGAKSSGTWNVSESTHFLALSDAKTRQTRTIKIAGLIKDQMSLKWQAPDLTAIYKYFYAK